MKRLIVCFVMVFTIAALTGCGGHKASESDVKFLTSAEYWWFYDEVTGEHEKMSFHEDFTFYWGCECGEPIGDSDLYELYDYDKENQIIKLYNSYDDTSMEMKVLDYSDYHLLLEQNGEIKDYICENSGISIDDSEEYLAGYNMYTFIMEGSAEKAVLGPFNYDGDIDYPENAFKAYDIAEDIIFYDFQVTKCIDDAGESCEKVYEELSREDGLERLNSGSGFIWFNSDMEIEKITYYGELINWL